MQLCDTKNDNIEALQRKKTCKKAVGKCKTAEVSINLMSTFPFPPHSALPLLPSCRQQQWRGLTCVRRGGAVVVRRIRARQNIIWRYYLIGTCKEERQLRF